MEATGVKNMKKIYLNAEHEEGLNIMVFAEGTILKPKSRLVLYNHNAYIPIGNAAAITDSWRQQGANIIYCTSRKNRQAEDIAHLLKKYGFTGAFLAVRESGDKYKDIVETLQPDILIEDDCKSIGGAWQMCITRTAPEIKKRIKSIVVPDFKGIDNLPTDVKQLQSF